MKLSALDMPAPIYGQTCLSLDLATASKIAGQMANHQEPQVYVPRIPPSPGDMGPSSIHYSQRNHRL